MDEVTLANRDADPNPPLDQTHDDEQPTSTPNETDTPDISEPLIKSEEVIAAVEDDHGGGSQRPWKRRKLEDTTPRRSLSRAISPPWKSFAADGPTTIFDNGVRKSSRVNKEVPSPAPEPAKRSTRHATKGPHTNGTTVKNGSRSASRAASGPTAPPKGKTTSAAAKKASTLIHNSPTRKSERQRKSAALAATATSPVSPVFHNGTPDNARKRAGRPRRTTLTSVEGTVDEPFSTPYHNGHDLYSGFQTSPDDTTSGPTPRLRLRLRKIDPPNRHPHHTAPPSKYPSFADWLQQDDPLEGEEGQRITNERAEEEAGRRLQIVEAAENGVLSQARCSKFTPQAAEEPPSQYRHWDFVVAHALHFNKLLKEEKTYHRRMAKTLAKEAFDYWKDKYKRKSKEEIEQEEAERQVVRYKQLVKDVKDAWALVKVEIDKERVAKWEEEQLQLGHKAMDDMFNQAQEILGRNVVDSASSFVSDDRDTEGEVGDFESAASNAASEENEAENMSSSSDSEDGGDDEDANLTAEQLRAKYEQLPDLQDDSSEDEGGSEDDVEDEEEEGTPAPTPDPDLEMEDAESESDHPFPHTNGFHSDDADDERKKPDYIDPATVELDAVDEALLDSEEEGKGSESGSEEWPSDDSEGEDSEREDENEPGSGEEEDEEDDDDDDAGFGMMGFLAPKEIKKLKEAAKSTIEKEGTEELTEATPKSHSNEVNGQPSTPDEEEDKKPQVNGDPAASETKEPHTNGDNEAAEGTTELAPSIEITESAPMEDVVHEKSVSRSRSRQTSEPAHTEIPSLLRGTLREYQHDGLDWLANLYDSDTNGILADEMGLGKTIQTISLLAYIAVYREVWGPHLVVVPTSVMLNWEMEFKKWCPGFKILTYYGDINERKRKRMGWRTTGRDMYNVVITSYQLILQDAAAFKMRAWHYLILDEAHNIKNFKSQRWQTMLNLRTERRLLLTGTPLQNNIDELWSLLYFLMPAGFAGEGRIAGLEEFTMALKNPTSQILEQGRQQLDAEALKIVKKLHEVLRPYLLRRLKSEVEKQMPAKYEHVVYCKLSKRQRQLYDGFMGRASTKEILASGNYMSIINCLMSLRKVCNHPDLFETRAIVTSMAMPKSVAAEFEIKDLFIRKRLYEGMEDTRPNLDALNLVFARREQTKMLHARRSRQIRALRPLEGLIERQTRRINEPVKTGLSQLETTLAARANREHIAVRGHLQTCLRLTRSRTEFLPIYGKDKVDFFTMDYQDYAFGAQKEGIKKLKEIQPTFHPPPIHPVMPYQAPNRFTQMPMQQLQHQQHQQHQHPQYPQHPPHLQHLPQQYPQQQQQQQRLQHAQPQQRPQHVQQQQQSPKEQEYTIMEGKRGTLGFRSPHNPAVALEWEMQRISLFCDLVPTLEQRAASFEPLVTRFTCVTPAVAAEGLSALTLSKPGVELIRSSQMARNRDPFHESRIRQSIAFPDKRLLQYDCGKLQRLAVLLRDLQAGGHRALIFTQMTKVLDILEQFLNIHGHRYLRLDGATKVEQRQILTDRFNNDPRILCFILSSRSGGLGINLTGADTVIFYDLDWNPAMDKQCQDRSHRIGQTRDVHIYKFVSEYTIEANILRKSNQKRLLDDVIIQKGDFTTDTFNRVTWRDALDDNTAAELGDEAGAAMDRVLGEKAGLLGDASVMGTVEDREDRNAASVAQKEIVDEIHDDQVDFNESSAATPAAGTRAASEAADGELDLNGISQKRHIDDFMLGWYREEYGKEPYKPPTDRQRRNRKGQDMHRTHRKKKY